MDTEFVWLQNTDIAAENPGNPDAGKARFAAGVADVWQQRGWTPCDPPAEVNPAIQQQPSSDPSPVAQTAAPVASTSPVAPTVPGGSAATTSRRPAGATAEEA